ncbi:unnamed protein product, partial [Brachionus calyciflorus]
MKNLKQEFINLESRIIEQYDDKIKKFNENLVKLYDANTKLAKELSLRIKACRICSKNGECSNYTNFVNPQTEFLAEKPGRYILHCSYS